MKVPLADAFTVGALYVAASGHPANVLSVSICVDDGGATDAACGNEGRVLMSCTVPADTAQPPTCSSATCADGSTSCRLSRGHRVFLWQSTFANSLGVSASLRLVSATSRWLSGICGTIGVNEVEMTMSGLVSTQCNQFLDESTCAVQLVTAATARAMEGSLEAPLTAGTWEMDLRLNQADTNPPLRCTLGAGSPTCSASSVTTLPAGGEFTIQLTPTGVMPLMTRFCASVAWQDMR